MENSPRKYAILLVEHEWPMIRCVKDALNTDHELVFVGAVENRSDLEQILQENSVDLALVDLSLPVMGDQSGLKVQQNRFEEGLWMIARIKELKPTVLVVPFSDFVPGNGKLMKETIKAGADAFLPKQDGPGGSYDWSEWLKYNLRSIVKGAWQMDANIARAISAEEEPHSMDGLSFLSDRQMEVLEYLADGKTDDEIASLLVLGHATIRSHVSTIQHKLHVHSRKEAIERFRRFKRNQGGD